jgi:hypothetical protein
MINKIFYIFKIEKNRLYNTVCMFFQFLRGGLIKFLCSVRPRWWVQMERQQAREDLDRMWGLEEEEDTGYFFVDPDDTFCLRQLFGMESYPEAAPPFGTEKWD